MEDKAQSPEPEIIWGLEAIAKAIGVSPEIAKAYLDTPGFPAGRMAGFKGTYFTTRALIVEWFEASARARVNTDL
jgi:hypothetical protein